MVEGEGQDQKIVLCLPFRDAECLNLEMNCVCYVFTEKGLQKA